MDFTMKYYTEMVSEFLGMDKDKISSLYKDADKRTWAYGRTMDLTKKENLDKYYSCTDNLLAVIRWHIDLAIRQRYELAKKLTGRILDYGAGIATQSLMASFVNGNLIELYDLECLCKEFTKFIIRKNNLQNIIYTDKPRGKYDCIVCTDVLEHLDDPLSTLKDFKIWLKSKGKIYIRAPFYITIDPTHKHPDYDLGKLMEEAGISKENYENVDI